MRFVRTILAFAIAVSLTVLPLGASAAVHAMSPDDTQHSMQMAGHGDDMSMDDCCPDDMKGKDSHKASHTNGTKCGMGLCCIGGALALADVRPIAFELTVAASKIAIPANQVLSYRGGSP